MKAWIAVALVAGATWAHAQHAPASAASAAASAPSSPAKKQLVAKVLELHRAGMDGLARQIAERPARQLLQDAGNYLQTRVPAEKREALAKTVEADVRKFVDEAVPVIRERAIKLAPSTIGALLEERFNEDELKQLVAWLESPVQRKYVQLAPEMDRSLLQKLSEEIGPVLDPKFRALQQKTRETFGIPAEAASAPASRPAAANGSRPANRPAAPARAAASAAQPASK